MDVSSSQDLIKDLSFCVFDLETTGGNHNNDKIIEIGLVKIEKLKIVDQKNYLIRPNIKIPEFIQKLTSISPKDVEKSPLIEDVIHEILAFIGDSILVAHNTSFDVPFFNSVLKRLNLPILNNKSICTNLMTKYLLPNLMNSNLNYMSKIFEIKHDNAHRALDDAKATAQLLLTYLNIFIYKDIKKINNLYYPRNKYELNRTNFQQGHSLKKISYTLNNIKSPYLCTMKGKNGTILFSLPCKNVKEEKIYIEKKLKTIKWHTMTIKLFGPHIEVISHFNNLFLKLDRDIRDEITNFLWKTHLPKKEIPSHLSNEKGQNVFISNRDVGDFVMANHLVPEQLIIFSMPSIHYRSSLIFRYPNHEKNFSNTFILGPIK